MQELVFRGVRFYSPIDEESFFTWLKRMGAVNDVYGHLDSIIVVVDASKVDDDALGELLAIHERYRVDMAQLKGLLTPANKHWFHDIPTAYWHKRVFG